MLMKVYFRDEEVTMNKRNVATGLLESIAQVEMSSSNYVRSICLKLHRTFSNNM
jgi:hypothetical protein